MKSKLAALSALVIFNPLAHAEVPASVLTSVTTAVTDVGVLGAAIFAVVIAIAVWGWLRRVAR